MLLPNAVMFSSGLLGIVFKLCLVSVYARKLKHIFIRKLMLLWQQADEIVHYCELLRMGTVYLLFRCPLDGSSVPADYNWILSPPSLSVTLISLPLFREWIISTKPGWAFYVTFPIHCHVGGLLYKPHYFCPLSISGQLLYCTSPVFLLVFQAYSSRTHNGW